MFVCNINISERTKKAAAVRNHDAKPLTDIFMLLFLLLLLLSKLSVLNTNEDQEHFEISKIPLQFTYTVCF